MIKTIYLVTKFLLYISIDIVRQAMWKINIKTVTREIAPHRLHFGFSIAYSQKYCY